MSSMKEKMHTGELYLPGDEEITERQIKCLDMLYDFNMTHPTELKKREEMLKEMFAEIGEGCYIEPPFYANFGGTGEIMSLYVRPADFHKGYGRALFEFVTDRLRESGFSEQYLWVPEENRRARAFYEAMGFYANGEKTTQNIGGKELAEVKYIKP